MLHCRLVGGLCHHHSAPLLEKPTGFPFQNALNIKSLVCISMLWMVLVLLTFLNCYMSTLHLVHYALLTPACWKPSNTNARVMAFVLSLALDPTFGIHSHKTLDTAQPCHLLKPNWKPPSSHSISILTYISTQFLLQSVCARARVCVCVCSAFCCCCFLFLFSIILYVDCFGRTMLYVCIEYHI